MEHIQGQNRNQLRVFSLEQMVEKQGMVRIIDAFVDMLDLETFGFNYYKLNKQGRPPFHPSTMMKLYLYGYQNGIRSCRKLEKACKTNIEVMWLINEQRPHYRTIANFRQYNSKALKEVFRYFVAVLKDWDMIDGKTVAIDSFKIRAQNSLKNNFNARKVKRHIDYIDKKIAEYEQELEEESEMETFRQERKAKIDYNKAKKEQYEKITEQLVESGDGQLSTTDPDSRAVVFQRNSVRIGYNIQAASDSKHKLLIAADTGDVNDTKALSIMVQKVQENLDMQGQSMDILADKGYHSGRELKACEVLQIQSYISPKESSSVKRNPAFAMQNFKYNEKEDSYTCPAGQQMRTNGNYYRKGNVSYRIKQYKTKSCRTCPIKDHCTTSKTGRVVERSEYQEFITRNNERVNANPDYYRQRQQIIEHQFGTFKRQMHFDHTLVRGKANVMTEVRMIMICYNLRRLLSIFTINELKSKLVAAFNTISNLRTIIMANVLKNRNDSCEHTQWIAVNFSYFGVLGTR